MVAIGEGPSRRGVLGVSGLALTGGAAAAWIAAPPAGEAPSDVSLTTLTRDEFVTLQALAEAIIAPAPGQPSAAEVRVAERIDREMSFHAGGKVVRDLKAALYALERAPAILLAGPRFTYLAAAERPRVLQMCARSPIAALQQAYFGVRFLSLFIYYSDDRTWDRIGYAGPIVAEKPFEAGNRIGNLAPRARPTAKAAA